MPTPVIQIGRIWCKRDDLYRHPSGAMGAKARVAAALLEGAKGGIVAATARNSSIPAVIARVAAHAGLPFILHTAAASAPAPDLELAREYGATILQHRPGYQSVLSARARQFAAKRNWCLLPLGLEDAKAIAPIANEVASTPWPPAIRRLVMVVGSGMMLSGVLHGIAARTDTAHLPVLGVCIGQAPEARIDRWAPLGWRHRTVLVRSETPFGTPVHPDFDFPLDPYYEAKVVPFLRAGDLFWIVALRASLCAS